jgi:subtilisin family serine protease
MSLGELDPSCGSQTALPDAIVNLADAGVWICIAAGNSTDNADFYSPGCFNHPRVLTIAAVDCENHCASFTNIGRSVDWYAVGVDVYSTYLDGGYATLFGTSMATPIVAGIIHSRGQAPIRGPEITCKLEGLNITTTKWLAKRH